MTWHAKILVLGMMAWQSAATKQAVDMGVLMHDLAHVHAHARSDGEQLFPGYGSAPFGFLLEADGHETLLCHRPVANFTADGNDAITGCTRQVRDGEHFPNTLLAAMPVLDGISVIVMGTPATTGQSRGAWMRTIYHEHFHQYAWALPGYMDRVKALDLAHGDTTGMWMLNFPFPYNDAKVQVAYRTAADALIAAVNTRGTTEFCARVDAYRKERAALAASVTAEQWRYFEFELWNEGTARWAENAIGKTDPDAEVKAASEGSERRVLEHLRTEGLQDRGREVVYATGAAEAMLMEAEGPKWRKDFPATVQMGDLLKSDVCVVKPS